MNLFVGVGKIMDVSVNGRVLKYNLFVQQERPCYVPCLIFDPDDEIKASLEQLQSSEQVVWLQGRIASSEFESKGRIIRKIEVLTYGKSIKKIL